MSIDFDLRCGILLYPLYGNWPHAVFAGSPATLYLRKSIRCFQPSPRQQRQACIPNQSRCLAELLGAKRQTETQIQRLGSSLITVSSGYRSAYSKITNRILPETEQCGSVRQVTPQINRSGTASYGSNGLSTTAIGTSTNYLEVRNLKMAQGVFLSDADIEVSTWNCVLGADPATELFEEEDLLGTRFRFDPGRPTLALSRP